MIYTETTRRDGLIGRWIHEAEMPWDDAPTWAVTALANVQRMVEDGRWSAPYPVGEPVSGHVLHCDGMWSDGDRVVEPQRNTCYYATMTWSDGNTDVIVLWRDEEEESE